MKENNNLIITNAKQNAKKYLQKLNKYFINTLHLEQDRSDPEYTFYWYKEQILIADMGIDSDEGILIVLVESKLFKKRMDLIVNNHVEFLEELNGEELMCIEIYSEADIELVKSLTFDIMKSY